MECGASHPDAVCKFVDPDRLFVVPLQPVDHARDPACRTSFRYDLPQSFALFANEKPIKNFPTNHRRQDRNGRRFIHQVDQTLEGIPKRGRHPSRRHAASRLPLPGRKTGVRHHSGIVLPVQIETASQTRLFAGCRNDLNDRRKMDGGDQIMVCIILIDFLSKKNALGPLNDQAYTGLLNLPSLKA